MSELRKLNKLLKKIKGKPMTKRQKKLLENLRKQVKDKKITVAEAHRIWNEKVLKVKKC